ncbi:GerMN domain-containing protein [Actinomycetota bacterium Odt1-20B]
MNRRLRLAALTAASAAVLAGCGVGATGPVEAGAPASGLRRPGSTTYHAQLYFVSPYGIQAVSRPVDSPATPQQALDLLLKGPDDAERARGLITEIPPLPGPLRATATTGAVDVYLPQQIAKMNGGNLGMSQIVCTVANAHVPGDRQPPAVDVRVHEPDTPEGPSPWTLRCNAAGNVVPVPNSASGTDR